MAEPSPITERERRVLRAACEAFHPALSAEPGDDALLFGTSAAALGVADAAEAAIALLPPVERAQLRQLLRLLDGPLLPVLLTGSPGGLMASTIGERERFLKALSSSRLAPLRSGFQALKRLSSFLFYALHDESGSNPVWPSIGYRPSPRAEARAEPLRLLDFSADTTLDCDVCVVGSGAGGGVVAEVLAARGLDVVVIEAGPPDQAADFDQLELEGTQRLYLDHGTITTRDLSVSILAGACLGGGTTVNWQTSLRTPDYVREEWTAVSGCALFTNDEFSLALDSAWSGIDASTDESVVNPNNATLQRGCAALGYDSQPLARNSRGCDLSQCGYCTFGCRLGSKQSTTVTYLREAQRMGNARIVASCRANRVRISNGRATGVDALFADANGRRHAVSIHARQVVVCAGGIHSPALLQRSGIELPALGRNLFLHPTSGVAGIYAQPIEPWVGAPQTIVSSEFARLNGNFGFRLEAAPPHPGLLASAMPWTGARAHRRLMQRTAHASSTIVLARDATGGRVRSRRDGSVAIDYRPGAPERALLARGATEATRIHFAAGAEEVCTMYADLPPLRRADIRGESDIDAFCARIMSLPVGANRSALFSAHQMGTCAMGRDRRAAVCDERGEVYGVKGLFVADASVFPASSGVNPMITVMAVAKCIAARMSTN